MALAVKAFLELEGVEVRLNADCISAEADGDGVTVALGGGPPARGTHLLLAVGRTPNTDDLGLELAGIETDERGYIEVDESLRTRNPQVWALGDCNGKGAFTHTSYNDYEIVADNLLADAGRKHTDRVMAYALYTDPPLGRVGMSEAEIRRAGLKALVGKRPMTRVARAVEKGETHGFLKIHVEESSQRILGAALLGTSCDEAVHSLIDVAYAGTTVAEFRRRMRIHPNVSELLPTVLENLAPLGSEPAGARAGRSRARARARAPRRGRVGPGAGAAPRGRAAASRRALAGSAAAGCFGVPDECRLIDAWYLRLADQVALGVVILKPPSCSAAVTARARRAVREEVRLVSIAIPAPGHRPRHAERGHDVVVIDARTCCSPRRRP